MTLTLTLPADLEQKLHEMAAQNGQDTADYARSLIEHRITNGHNSSSFPAHPAPQHEISSVVNAQDEEDNDPKALAKAIAKITNRTPEQIAEIQARALALYKPERPLPPGKTFAEVVAGKWPGHETDEEVQTALDKLS